MGSACHRLLDVCAIMLMAIAVANAASGEVASLVVGQAKCADCTRKNMKAEAAFKGKIDVYIVVLATLLNDDQSILDVLMAP